MRKSSIELKAALRRGRGFRVSRGVARRRRPFGPPRSGAPFEITLLLTHLSVTCCFGLLHASPTRYNSHALALARCKSKGTNQGAMHPQVSAPLVLLFGVLVLAFVSSVVATNQLTCNPGTYGGYTALATNSAKQTTCDRTSACYSSGAPANCTFSY